MHGASSTEPATLPAYARSPLNRCNLPAVILGSLTFQQHPTQLYIDGVRELHGRIFLALDRLNDPEVRAGHFRDYMSSAFLLDHSDEAGLDPQGAGRRRDKANYLRLLRGWMFNADGIEAAVLKRWAESRFGLLARSHRGPLDDPEGEACAAFRADYTRGLYNTNALDAQLDVLYSFCQYELGRRWPERSRFLLFRGVNRIDDHEVLERDGNDYVMLLNNLNSFSDERLQSDSFGDWILEAQVPAAKLLYFPGLLPGVLQGESEYLVLGGVYRVRRSC